MLMLPVGLMVRKDELARKAMTMAANAAERAVARSAGRLTASVSYCSEVSGIKSSAEFCERSLARRLLITRLLRRSSLPFSIALGSA